MATLWTKSIDIWPKSMLVPNIKISDLGRSIVLVILECFNWSLVENRITIFALMIFYKTDY